MSYTGAPTRHRRGAPVHVVERPTSPPRMPAKLGPAGKSAWRLVWGCSWIAAVDAPVVERYARLSDERVELQKLVARDGRTARGSMGQVVTAPAVEQLRAVEALLLKIEQVLGLGPLFRARLGIAVADLAARQSTLDRLMEVRARNSHDPRLDAES